MSDRIDDASRAPAERRAAQIPAMGDVPGGLIFRTALLASTDGSSLAELPPALLEDHVRQALAFLAKKPRGHHKVAVRRIMPAAAQGARPMSVLEILNDDMPFLLDSVLGEISTRGLSVHLALHPIFKTRRTDDGTLQAVTAEGDRNWSDGHQESYISLHLDALSDADAASLKESVSALLDQVRVAVRDWRAMLDRIGRGIEELEAAPASVPRDQLAEAVAFLRWLVADNFTFLGARDLRLVGDAETGELEAVPGSGLGLLRDPAMEVLRRGRELVSMTPEVRRFFFQPSPLIITKANVVSRVHRRVHMDYVGVKIYGAAGLPVGELRLVGLFTSTAYTQSPLDIPLLRHKVRRVIAATGAPPESHAGKAIINVLESFPRDEMFQISAKDLERWTAAILDLEVRPRVRVLVRADRFDRFVSVLLYIPRDRTSTSVRERVAAYLCERFNGTLAAFYPHYSDGPLVRVQFIIARQDGVTPQVPESELEAAIRGIAETWQDRLGAALSAAGTPEAIARAAKYQNAFSAGYADEIGTARALEDVARIERLGPDRTTAVDFYRDAGAAPAEVRVAIYRFDDPIRLSERVPVLENLGFSVVDEHTYRVHPRFAEGERSVVLHDMVLEWADGHPHPLDADTLDQRLEDAFIAVLKGAAENDGFNRLVATAGATWREAAIMRCYAAYLRQLGSPFGLRYVADTLVRNAGVARDLLDLFMVRSDPDRVFAEGDRAAAAAAVRARIDSALAGVASLDEDRILRQIVTLSAATLRTNFFQRDAAGNPPETIAFKFDGRALDMAPAPRSYREIWVSSPRVDSVHLRFAPIARGGIRWSDRPLDFRTEVLGLAKAQQVKNAVIVPAGAKGGYVPKLLPRTGTREAVAAEGLAAYKIFISAMLDLTDDIHDGKVVPPPRVVRYDGDDPYLVVAADKGTATFSDTANGIAKSHGFWLDDAFASGGSAGYDHKGIGITSRGAWECVKRHFREMDIDVQTTPIRVAGVGDMSGDVFGNGMLRSRKIALVAAFDHRDIFLDPQPDPEASFVERKRLFDLPRSSWADYDRKLISQGGGVFSRSLKSVPLSPQVRSLLKLTADAVTPVELIRAILMSEVDLLFFGGIGTYIRATAETNEAVGDRANDALRITGAEIGARVIGEGANLAMTQRGRIEAATRGVRLNTDFIDNSAGVNCSDQEVNIKIALGPVVRSGRLTLAARDTLLRDMTGDVASAVLRNNYQQSLALSLAERRAPADLAASTRLIRSLEARGLLDRALEALPTDREIAERQRGARGLVRPELAVLLSYGKIALLHDLLASKVPDDPFMGDLLIDYFPPVLQRDYAADLAQHRLRREIIATTLTNGLVNRLGAPTPLLLADETGRPVTDTAFAFMAARSVFSLADLWRRIDALDGQIKGAAQLQLYERVRELLVEATRVFLRDGGALADLSTTIARHRAGLEALRAALADVLPAATRAQQGALQLQLAGAGVPADLAAEIASLPLLAAAPVIVETARQSGSDVVATARLHFEIGDRFRLDDIATRARAIRTGDDYDRLAIAGATAALSEARRAIVQAALVANGSDAVGLERWIGSHAGRVDRVASDLGEIAGNGDLTVARLTVAAARLSDLARERP